MQIPCNSYPHGRFGSTHRWGTRIGRLLATLTISIAVVTTTAAPSLSSLTVPYITVSVSGKVVMNLLGMNGLPWDEQFRSVHVVEAIDVVRQDLLQRHRIRDLPILVWSGSGSIYLGSGSACELNYGDAAPFGPYMENCYGIVGAGRGFEDLLAMTVALPELSEKTPRLDMQDPTASQSSRSLEIQRHRKTVLHFDPIWSPNGARLIYTVWESGAVRFEVLELPSRTAIKLEPLGEYMATRPIWSGDSRFIAYASLRTVKVFDTQKRTTWTFHYKEEGGAEVGLQFEGMRLRFSRGFQSYTSDGVYVYDPSRQELLHPGGTTGVAGTWDLTRHGSLDPVRSPVGHYVATFVFADGQRRIEIKALQ
jgi:hypothetical protein